MLLPSAGGSAAAAGSSVAGAAADIRGQKMSDIYNTLKISFQHFQDVTLKKSGCS